MSAFLNALFDILKGFIYGASDFISWLTTPLEALQVFGLNLTPLMIFGFATFTTVFLMVLVHLFNPLN